MSARVFRGLDRIFLRAFSSPGEEGYATWYRFDTGAAHHIRVIFNRRYSEVSVDGFRVDDGQPTIWVSLATARMLAPERTEDLLFDNNDHVEVSGVTYAVESCRADGQTMIEVRLSKRV